MKKAQMLSKQESTGEIIFSQVFAEIFMKTESNKGDITDRVAEMHSCDECHVQCDE